MVNRDGAVEFLEALRDRGQGLVEYGLIIALVAVVAIAGLMTLGPTIGKVLFDVSNTIQNVHQCPPEGCKGQ